MYPGLYILRRRAWLKDHVSILVVGNLLGLPRPGGLFSHPTGLPPLGVLIDFTPDGIRREVLYELGDRIVERQINDLAAMARLMSVLERNPRYDPVFNNCEHFVSYVETGRPKSPQVRGLTTLAGLALAIWWGFGGSGGAGAGVKR